MDSNQTLVVDSVSAAERSADPFCFKILPLPLALAALFVCAGCAFDRCATDAALPHHGDINKQLAAVTEQEANLAGALLGQGKYAEAETLYRDVIKIEEDVLGPEHPNTLRDCYNLALCLAAENKLDEAKAFAKRAADGASKTLGADNPDTLKYKQFRQEADS
jgi:tetratricopeptide (TPR) repeat protein